MKLTKGIITVIFLVSLNCSAQNLDIRLLKQINTPHDLKADNFMRGASNSVFIVALSVPCVLMTWGGIKNDNQMLLNSLMLIVSTTATFALTDITKWSVQRERPYDRYANVLNKSKKQWNDPSFPSGHTSTAFSTATYLSLAYRKVYIIIPVYAWACTVAYSRMYLGVHYLSDVLGGAIIGSGCAFLTWKVNQSLHKHNHPITQNYCKY
jgi:undecaprenyl-diphosphatase